MIRWALVRGNPSIVFIRDTEAETSEKIRWFSRHPGEEQGSWVNHVAHLLSDLWGIVEALFAGVEEGTLEKYDKSETTWGLIVELVGFTREQHLVADGAALLLVGSPYHYVGILKQAIDGFFSKLARRDIYAARRFHLPGLSATICSQLVVKVHKAAKWIIMGLKTIYRKVGKGWHIRIRPKQVLGELPAGRATPDDIWDDVFEHRPWLYRVVAEINPHLCPEDLIPVIRAKIDRDMGIHRA